MASSLATQLSQVAAKASHQFDLKAQRSTHAQSLILEKKVAATQDFETIFQLCYEGYQELCALDPRFISFRRNIFSDQSISEDRGQLTAGQNQELDGIIEDFLALVGGRLLLNPAVKAVDWLIRRFRVHEHNTSFLLFTFLPYHTTPLFQNLLSILPEDLTPAFKALYPYKRSLTLPPRHPIVQSAVANKQFFAAFNNYVLRVCKQQAHYQGLVSFWAGITTEALSAMLDAAKAGRIEVERKNNEDILLRILPTLNTGFGLKKVPELVVACYMICVVLVNKSSLSEHVLDSLMEAVVGSWAKDTTIAGITCLSALAQHKDDGQLPKKVVKSLVRLDNVAEIFAGLTQRYSMSELFLATINGLVSIAGDDDLSSLVAFVDQILRRDVFNTDEMKKSISVLMKRVDELRRNGRLHGEIRAQISDLLANLNESRDLSAIVQAATRESDVDISSLELSLEIVIGTEGEAPETVTEDIEMEDVADSMPEDEVFSKSIESLSSKRPSAGKESFLVETASPLFHELADTFVRAVPDKKKIATFTSLPILRGKDTSNNSGLLTFLMRLFSSPYHLTSRAAAISMATSEIAKLDGNGVDMQAFIPYAIAALADPSERARREAAGLLVTVGRQSETCNAKSQEGQLWGQDFLYGSKKSRTNPLHWLSTNDAYKIIHRVLLPGLEETTLDPNQIGRIVVHAIRGEQLRGQSGSSELELKRGLRHDFFSFLCSHIIHTPIVATKLRLLRIANQVGKVGSTTRTQILSPLLKQWRLVSEEEVKRMETEERVSVEELEEQILSTIYPKDQDAVGTLLSLVTKDTEKTRPSFVNAAFKRFKEIWPSLKEENEIPAAERLLDVCLATTNKNEDLANGCRDLLRAVELSGPVVYRFLSKVSSDLDIDAPAPKRRRTSQNHMVATNPAEANVLLQKITFILELIDGSSPEKQPELLGGLFQTLAAVQHLKTQIQSEMSYILSLNLGILLAIIKKLKDSPKKLDTSVIRVNLIIDCIRTSESPQVQNTALLVVAGLATIAPELVLHSVMPIFTFMGSSVLKKDDEYSALVIDQTIDQVVPPLVRSLRAQKRDVVSGTSELLLSFTAAYMHIPSYRRMQLFESLLSKLGQEDFLFAVLAMLATKYGMDKDVLATMTSLASKVGAELQLITYARYLNLVQDALKPKPTLARVLLGVGAEEGKDSNRVAANLLQTLSHLLKFTSLSEKMTQYFESDTSETAQKVHSLFSSILEHLLSLSEAVRSIKPISNACGRALSTFLGTLSLVDFIDTIEVLLQRPGDELRRKVLRLLENRLESSNNKDKTSYTRSLEFLSTLLNIVQTSDDILLKHAAVACIEKISEKYGKKDLDKVVEAATIISGDKCIGETDNRIRVMGLLCIASMVEVATDAIIPILPVALPRSLALLEVSMEPKEGNPQLHDAAYSVLSALLVHVPWMVSAEYLDRILQLSAKSAYAALSEDAHENRREALQLFAKKVEMQQVFGAVERNWTFATTQGPVAAEEALEVVKVSIQKHPKSTTAKNVSTLMKLILNAFDLRRTKLLKPYDEQEVESIESSINDMTIKMIYKLNDSTFRPLFVQLTEWATSAIPKSDTTGRVARLTTFYKFLDTFFGTLKSIVTGYSGYILENVVDVLKATSSSNIKTMKPLWLATMRTLRNSFEYDQDEYWQSPSHLAAISEPLVKQLAIATSQQNFKLVIAETIPTITALAAAADSPDNHKELNTLIMKFMRAGGSGASGADNSYTRLAAVKCEQSLTESLGEEWLALLPEMLPYISELMEDDDENVEREVRKWVLSIEDVLGEKLDDMLV